MSPQRPPPAAPDGVALDDRARVARLTPRQLEVLELLAKGLTNDDIGGVLGLSAATVRNHVTGILTALEVTNRTEATARYIAAESHPERVGVVLARPAIAVLPLVVLDEQDARARTIASAITRDLTALFAAACWFPVISQLSMGGVRAGGVATQAIGHALGARFLVDGALLRLDDRWRLDIQIDDAETGHCLFTERHTLPDADLFRHADDLCAVLVAHAYPVLVRRIHPALSSGRNPQDLAAWELAHHAMDLCATRDHGANATAAVSFEQAITRDPLLVLAHFGRGLAAYDAVLNQWGDVDRARARLAEAAEQCVAVAPHGAEGHYLRARYWQTRGDHTRTVPELEAAIAHNPSFAQAHALLAQALHLIGRSDEALVRMRHALRLGPRGFVAGLANLHWMRHEYAEALAAAETAIVSAPRYTFARVLAAVSAHHLGERARAADHLARLKADYPPFDARSFRLAFGAETDPVLRIGVALEAMGAR